MRRTARSVMVIVLPLVLGAGACKNKDKDKTASPGDATAGTDTDRPGPRVDASGNPIPELPPGPTEAPEMQEKAKKGQKTPLPQDRDPEEEKRKMAASRDVSAKAKQALRSGDLTRAIEEARQALRVHEQNVEAMLVIAEAFFKQGKWEITQGVATAVLDVDPRRLTPQESSQAYNLRGFAYLSDDKREQAKKMFRSAAEIDAKNAAAWNNLGVQYMQDGDFETAATCFKYATDIDASFTKAQLNYGTALRGQAKLVEAEAQFQKMISKQPSYAAAHFNLGVLYLDAEDFPNLDLRARYNKAITAFTKYKELAISQGHKSADDSSLSAMERAMLSSRKLVSPEQADLYIELAKKGIEREDRREEREKERKEREAKKKAKEAEKAESGEGAAGAADPPAEDSPKEDPPKTQKPGGGS